MPTTRTIDLGASDFVSPFPTVFEQIHGTPDIIATAFATVHRIDHYVDTHDATAVLQGQDARVVTKLVEGTKHGKWTVHMTNMDALHVYVVGWKWIAIVGGVGPLQACLQQWISGVSTPDEATLDRELWREDSVAWMRAILNAVAAARRIRKDP